MSTLLAGSVLLLLLYGTAGLVGAALRGNLKQGVQPMLNSLFFQYSS